MNQSLSCIICSSTKQDVIRDTLRYGIKRNVLRCRKCGFVFLETVPRPDYYFGKEYRRTYGPNLKKDSDSREIFEAYFPVQERIIQRMKNFLKADMKVLDVGCSTGHFLSALKNRVKERVGLELSREHADFIKSNLDFKVYSEPIESANVKEGPFDLVTAFQTLEHVEKPIDFLKGIARNLKSDGHLYLELPNIDDALLSVYCVTGYEDFYYREPHVSYFSKKTLGALLNKAGFEGKISTIQDYGLFNHLRWIFTNKPQDNFAPANSNPLSVKDKKLYSGLKKDLNDFAQRIDEEYKSILEKCGIGETLTFLGKKINAR